MVTRSRQVQPSPAQVISIRETSAPVGVFVAVGMVGSYQVFTAVYLQLCSHPLMPLT